MKSVKNNFQVAFVIFTTVLLIATSVFTLIQPKYTWNKLVSEADYIVTVTREMLRCEEKDGCYVMCGYSGKEPYTKNGKTYTEVYITLCKCSQFLGDKITIVTDNNYLTEKTAYYTLFLKCIDIEKEIYIVVGGNSGIIKWERRSLSKEIPCHPLDLNLNTNDITDNFLKYAYEDFTHYCPQNELTYMECSFYGE